MKRYGFMYDGKSVYCNDDDSVRIERNLLDCKGWMVLRRLDATDWDWVATCPTLRDATKVASRSVE